MKPCPCERGFIKGRLRGVDLQILPAPLLDCAACEGNYDFKLVMCRDPWEGNYWYEWRLIPAPGT
ncbi:MAG: hypothetical protein ACTSPB_08225 [Candidatus Thorarchaeota archaeon]